MSMNGEIEGTATLLLRAAGASPDGRLTAEAIASRLLGGRVRSVPPHVLRRDGALARVGGEWCVFLRSDLPPARRAFTILHEVSHWAIGHDAPEAQCDALAAAMVAPRCAFLDAMREHGARLPKLASRFCTTESCVALRLGEATGRPLALVTPQRIHLRGAAFSWPSEPELRAIAAGQRLPGLRSCRLKDERERAVLRAG